MSSATMKNKWGVFLMILLVTIGYQLLMAIPISPLGAYEGCDSLVFRQMGLAMLQDKVLYLDLFDHKGVIIYFINAFCQWLVPGRWGLFLFFCLYMAIVTYVWWLISSLLVKSKGVIWPVVMGLFLYMIVLSDGNLSEEWSLLPISYSLYVFVRHFVEDREISSKEFFFVGLSMGVVTFLRINNMAAICCAVLFYVLYHLYKKSVVTPAQLFRSLVVAFIGWAVVIVSCSLVIGVLYGYEGIREMIYGTFTFNFEYMSYPTAVALDRKRVFLYYGLTTLVILSFLWLKKRSSVLTPLVILCYIGSFVAIGSKGWGNYFIILAPLTVVATAIVYNELNKWQKALVFLMFFIGVLYKLSLVITAFPQDQPFYADADAIIQKMPGEEQKQIWNVASFDGLAVLQRNGLTQANRVMLPFQMLISERLLKSESERFERIAPVWIMTDTPLQETVPMSLDSVKVTRQYTLHDIAGKEGGRRLYFYKANKEKE